MQTQLLHACSFPYIAISGASASSRERSPQLNHNIPLGYICIAGGEGILSVRRWRHASSAQPSLLKIVVWLQWHGWLLGVAIRLHT